MRRTALIGVAHWHVPLYLDALAETHDVVAVSDPDAATAQAVADRLGATVHGEWRQMLDTAAGLDLVYVFGRHDEMAAAATDAVRRGLAVVVEKPAGIALHEVERLAVTARDSGVPVAVPLVQRDGPVHRALGSLGRPTSLTFAFLAGPPQRYLHSGSPWMLDPEVAGGGSLTNLGVHFVDLYRVLTGDEARSVRGVARSDQHRLAVDDHAVVLVQGERSCAVVEVGYVFPDAESKRHVQYVAAGPGGLVAIGTDGTVVATASDGTVTTEVIDVDSDPLYDAFVRAVAAAPDDLSGLPALEDLLPALRVVAGAYADHAGRAMERMPTWAG